MKVELTKEEVKYILNDLLCDLSSVYQPNSYKKRFFEDFENDSYDEVLKYPYDCFSPDISESDFKLIRSIIEELKKGDEK